MSDQGRDHMCRRRCDADERKRAHLSEGTIKSHFVVLTQNCAEQRRGLPQYLWTAVSCTLAMSSAVSDEINRAAFHLLI